MSLPYDEGDALVDEMIPPSQIGLHGGDAEEVEIGDNDEEVDMVGNMDDLLNPSEMRHRRRAGQFAHGPRAMYLLVGNNRHKQPADGVLQGDQLAERIGEAMNMKAAIAESNNTPARNALRAAKRTNALAHKTINAWFINRGALCTVIDMEGMGKPWYIYAKVETRPKSKALLTEFVQACSILFDPKRNALVNETKRQAHYCRGIKAERVTYAQVVARLVCDYVSAMLTEVKVSIVIDDVDPNTKVRQTRVVVYHPHYVNHPEDYPANVVTDEAKPEDETSLLDYYRQVSVNPRGFAKQPDIIHRRNATCIQVNIDIASHHALPPLEVPESIIRYRLEETIKQDDRDRLIATAQSDYRFLSNGPCHHPSGNDDAPWIDSKTKWFVHDNSVSADDGIMALFAKYVADQDDEKQMVTIVRETDKINALSADRATNQALQEQLARIDRKAFTQISKQVLEAVRAAPAGFVNKSQSVEYVESGETRVGTVKVTGASRQVDEQGHVTSVGFPHHAPREISMDMYALGVINALKRMSADAVGPDGNEHVAQMMGVASQLVDGEADDVSDVLMQLLGGIDALHLVSIACDEAAEQHVKFYRQLIRVSYATQKTKASPYVGI